MIVYERMETQGRSLMAARQRTQSKTDWQGLKGLPDAAPVATREWFERARRLEPQRKTPVSMPARPRPA
jgi:hypothetical protein